MVCKHKKPVDACPSKYLVHALERFTPKDKSWPVLDLPCGYGRNAKYLAQQGFEVICADYDPDVFSDYWYTEHSTTTPILLNATTALPFRADSFSMVAIIHYYTDELFKEAHRILKYGGIVVFESFGGQGNNWKELPSKEFFNESFRQDFVILSYKEKLVGPEKANVSVKLIAQKKAA